MATVPPPEPPPTPPAPEPAGEPESSTDQQPVSARIRQLAEAIGPTTLATALLVYFGYVATRARYQYFGVPLDMTGLSNQDLMLQGLEVVYVPAALMFLGVLTCVGIHAFVKWLLARDTGDDSSTTHALLAYLIMLVGVLLIARALIGMFVQDSDTSVIIGATPLSLAIGPAAVAYGIWVYTQQRGRTLLSRRLARNGALCAVGLFIAGLFWASTQLAWAYGTGRGEEDASRLDLRPEVVIDTKEPLDGLPTGVTAIRLDDSEKEARAYHHRYAGFRLLLSSGGRLFLVTPDWELGRDRTIVLPYGDDIRVQLMPQP
ncbi:MULTISPECIES: hypothetical protein [unclassified Streptomyces]|uniref:hypothetical protein n=1 Tax=unclassified Streptomyces TaxID=2593676 RepID=UPI0022519959|nr:MULTISPECIES: hypothetical protein [unclassified Streptomyces]MCX5328975.1 hypothetical protein [Streptomyces sp. NBC_00140]MCX5358386.1 hypothetical protein [Streptomyces sp. NBC_00124]